jgi:hypothetical protein
MTTLRLTTHFRTSGLGIADSLLGANLSVPAESLEVDLLYDAIRVNVVLPEDAFDTDFASSARGMVLTGPGDISTPYLTAIRVVVEADIAEIAPETLDSQWSEVQEFISAAESMARQAAARIMDLARLRGQYWLGLMGEAAEEVDPRFVEVVGGDRLDIEIRWVPTLYQHPVPSLGLDDLNNMAAPSEEDTTLIFRRLLNDALYLSHARGESDVRHGVVLAAVAAEVAVKRTLLGLASSAHADLVNEMLGNYRDFSPQASNLFHKFAKIILGASLQEKDKHVFADLTQLFSDRNNLVHRRDKEIPIDRCRKGVRAAKEAIDWLLGFYPEEVLDGESDPKHGVK